MTLEDATLALTEITEEIAQLDARISFTHGLGDSNSAGGINTSFADTRYWTQRRGKLRIQRSYYTKLIEYLNGTGAKPAAPTNILVTNFQG